MTIILKKLSMKKMSDIVYPFFYSVMPKSMFEHYSYSQVTVPNSAHSNQSGDQSAHQKSFPQAVPMQMNPPPQAAGYVVNVTSTSFFQIE